ncbi:uncharacterized protein [Mytilus edulis]|uniref:uncharacterized protein n=1 Tax=Mytilus edulis TaxID=6550 RepID=UPI0039F0B708
MRVHVFGNCPSPAVASYCLRKAASVNKTTNVSDIVEFVNRNCYVDDGLVSLATPKEAIDLLQRTRESLQTGGNLRLHKIASNSKEVMDAFEHQDRANNFKDIDLCVDELPTHQSLGLNWELETDTFTYKVSPEENPFCT